ncbi:hypothetical protein [Vibrio lentus]|uniref:hypothetical protein n=1 Tax=Vibrio lentus TaxID=136468 RepID=UPI0012FFE630|nr:hypothetical protein [Vibrio lentus]
MRYRLTDEEKAVFVALAKEQETTPTELIRQVLSEFAKEQQGKQNENKDTQG